MKKMHRSYTFLFLIFAVHFLFSQQPQTTKLPNIQGNKLRISILTCGQGPDLYSTFGHSAVRVVDSTEGTDIVYNYGTFEYSEDISFYVKFTRGKLRYLLSTANTEDFISSYIAEGRGVSEQIINLNVAEKAQIKAFLENNLKPENRYYKYDFYYDNCSTRIRDIFEKVLGKKLAWHVEQSDGKTMRRHLNPYITEMPWIKWGFYLTLGNVTDVKADHRTKMFLPFELDKALDKAQYKGDSLSRSLVLSKTTLVEQKYVPTDDFLLDPVYCVLFVILLVGCYVSHLQFYRDIYWKWYDLFLFNLVGLLGLLILFLWFLTDHQTTHWNFNLFWALPSHVVYLALMMNYRRFYAYTIIAWILMGISVLLSLMQPFHLATYIVIFILAMRLFVNYRYAKHYNVRRLAFSKIF